MILVTKLDGQKIVINAEEIETIEIGPNSVISLKSGKKYLVRETHEELTNLVIEYKKKVYHIDAKVEGKQTS
ncbi:MAG: flagellar FlbD family protein [Ignavibacteria bacterium]|nr:flagellar FlbD family protein [Ignavibacteria bacterium]